MRSIAILSLLSAAAQAQPETQPDVQCLGGYVFFKPGSARLDRQGRLNLDSIREFATQPLLPANGARLVIYASTDASGTESANLALSRRRGEAVRRYLESIGFRRDRISIIAEGENPGSEAGRTPPAELRRAYVIIETPRATWDRYIPPGLMC